MLNSCSKYFLLLFYALYVLAALAQRSNQQQSNQKMWVESFTHEINDPTANREGTRKTDLDGQTAALIKIETTQHGFSFDTGSLGVIAVEEQNSEHPAEIWVYVPRGVKFIEIQHPILGKLRYPVPVSIQKAQTYRMVLTSNEVSQMVIDPTKSETVNIEVFPSDASLYINYTPINKTLSGKYSLPLFHGTNNYRVVADNYYPEEGKIKISDTEKPDLISIRLKQAFGYLSIPETPETKGAEVYVDNKKIGNVPVSNSPVATGRHDVLLNQKLYKPYITQIEMTDSAFANLSPVLVPNYAEVDFVVSDPDVTIYDNGTPLNVSGNRFTAKLEEGHHLIEVKKPSHESTSKEIDVLTGRRQSVGLESPHPIYGFLTASSNPSGATVYLNGKEEGVTPLREKQVLVGNYTVTFSKSGYKDETRNITVTKGDNTDVSASLNGFCRATLYSDPTFAPVYIDGKYVGLTPHRFDLFTGTYKVVINKEGYLPYSKNISLSASTPDITVKLRHNLIKERLFYIQAGYNVMGVTGLNFGIGGYIKNINLEANYLLGLGKSEEIFWNSTSGYSYPVSSTYTPWGMDFKVGYGIGFAGRFRVTPQAGWQGIFLKENDTYDNSDAIADTSSAGSITIGTKLEVIPINHLGISVTPQYMIPVSMSDYYKSLKEVSSKIKGYVSGFSLNISINVFF